MNLLELGRPSSFWCNYLHSVYIARAVCIPTSLYIYGAACMNITPLFFLPKAHNVLCGRPYSNNNNIYPVCGYEFYFVVEWQVLFACWRAAGYAQSDRVMRVVCMCY